MRLYEKPTWRDARIILLFAALLAGWVTACICLRGPIGIALFVALLITANLGLPIALGPTILRRMEDIAIWHREPEEPEG